MNKCYKTIWNETSGAWVAVQEGAASHGKAGGRKRVRGLRVIAGIAFSISGLTLSAYSEAQTAVSGTSANSGGSGSAASIDSTCSQNFVDRQNPGNQSATPGSQYILQNGCSTAIGNNANAQKASVAIGDRASASDSGISIGVGASTTKNSAIAIGTVALATGNTSFALGRQSAATADYATAIGNVAYASGESGIAMGHSAFAQGYRSIAIGSSDSRAAGNDGVSSGATYNPATQTRASGIASVALGAGAVAAPDGSIALGANSVGAANATGPARFSGDAIAPGGALSVGSTGAERQVRNVAGGTAGTDAVNLNQLSAVANSAVQYDDATKGNVTLGGATSTDGGVTGGTKLTNVTRGAVSATSTDAVNGSQLYQTNQQLSNVGTQVAGNTTNIAALQQDALQWNATLGAYDASHGSGAPQQIANLAQGVKGTDAVNVDQLNAAVKTGVGQLDSLAVKYDDASKQQVSLGGGNGGAPVRVTNVAEGGVSVGSTDAVNGSQLRHATDSVAAALGGGATANTNGSINAPKYDVGGATFNNVGDALGNIDTRVAGNTTAIAGLQQDALRFDPGVGAYNAAHGGVAAQITNVADGGIAAGSKDAVNGGQLYGVKSDLEQQITNVSNQAGDAVKNVVKYDVDANGNRLNSVSLVGGNAASPVVLKNVATGVDDTDAVNVKQLKSVQSSINQLGAMAVTYDDSSKGVITLGGAGGTKITNVQAGTLGATSTDAVNGSQLHATNQQVAKNTTDITNLQENVTNVTNGKAGLVQQQDPNGQVTVGAGTGGTSVNFANSANADRVLTGVAAGVNSNDAVNVGQLNSVLKDVRTSQEIKAAVTDANTSWIAHADAGAFGATATASGKNAVAVGQGSVADRDNSFSVGAKGNERQVTNVAAGTAPTDAVNVQQLNDNVAAASGASRGYTDQRIGQVYNDLNNVKKDMFGGVASAMAVAGLPQPTAPGRSMVSAATSNYRGQQGFAAGYSYLTQNDKWVVKASVTGNSRSDFGAVVGAGYQF
ncbi:YadA-like family protein [Burkholderia ubonensis]|uniref:YadA-like family protein n=1 Tax=Burkholderia ubonensis TaxID=101571 RepID=UPI000A103A08|nr:YadA-like family protein [Burkholderia ubonensis]